MKLLMTINLSRLVRLRRGCLGQSAGLLYDSTGEGTEVMYILGRNDFYSNYQRAYRTSHMAEQRKPLPPIVDLQERGMFTYEAP